MKIGGKEIKLRPGAWILLPALILAWLSPQSVTAEAQAGLAVTVYNNYGYNGSPPLPTVSGRPVQCTTTYLSIDQNFGNNICGLYDDFIVKYEGYITSPTTETITFYPSADDGTKLYIDDVLVDDNWRDKGGGGNPSTPINFIAGVPKPITLWFYENGGGNWVQLSWSLGGNYSIVPAEAFTQNNESPYAPTTTTVAPYLNPPQNLTAVANPDGSVDLDWDAPTASNVDIYAYSVSFYDLDEIGGTTSGGWGVWTNQGTNYSLAEYMFSGSNPVTTGFGPVRFGIKAGNQSCFSGEGVGPCVYGPEVTVDATVIDPTPTTTTEPETTTSENTTTTTEVIQEPEITTTIPLPDTGTTSSTVEETTTTMETVPETIPITEEENVGPGDFTESTVQDSIPEPEAVSQDETPTQETSPELPLDTQDAADAAVADIFDGPMSNLGLSNAVDDLVADAETPEELTAVVSSLLDQELTDTQFSTVIDSVFDGPMSNENFSAAVDAVFEDTSTLSDEQFDTVVQAVFDGPLSTEQFGDALDAVFDEQISDEKFNAIIDAVLDEPLSGEQFEELVGVLESGTVTEEQVADAVDSMIENGVTEDQATELATSEKVLESISADAASEIFNEIPVDGLSDEQGQAIVDAVQDAPIEIKEAFEEEINVFDGAFDTYVPTDSSISVGERRTVVAVTVVSSVIAVSAASAPSAPSGPSGGNSGPSGGNPSGGDTGGGSAPSEDKGSNKSRGRRRK